MPKLRKLVLFYCEYTSDQAADKLSMIGNLLEKGKASHIESDFTKQVEGEKAFKKFLWVKCKKSIYIGLFVEILPSDHW